MKDAILTIVAVFLIVVILFIVFVFYKNNSTGNLEEFSPVATVPVLTEEINKKLEKSTGFDVLVMYNSHGFQPTNISIQAGQTIRISNNNIQDLFLKASTTHIIKARDFEEFTFTQKGKWVYTNEIDPNQQVTVIVN